MQLEKMSDWYRVGGLATVTFVTLMGFATEILHLWKGGF